MVSLLGAAPQCRSRRRCALVFGLSISLLFIGLLTGCEDASNVGLGLVEDEGGEPEQVTLNATNVGQRSYVSNTSNRLTFLTGHVQDPLFGELQATGFVDLRAPSSLPESFQDEDNPIEDATFRLRRSYLYGDTTGSTTLALHRIPSSWTVDGTRADTSITTGEQITTVTVQPTDTLIEIPLPENWRQENSSLLRSDQTAFEDDFHGFELRAADASAVQGFYADSSALRVIVAEDTAAYSISQDLTTIERQSQPASNADHAVVQNGIGPAVSMDFSFDADSLQGSVLNQATVMLPVDVSTMQQQTPAGFVRPLPESLSLFGVDEDGERTLLQRGELVGSDHYRFGEEVLTAALQRVLLGSVSYDRYLVTGTTADAVTINGLLLYNSSETKQPYATLTMVPVDN